MKSILKNKVFYALAMLCLAFCLCWTGVTLSSQKANAATYSVTFEEGASIRIDSSENQTSGIRFTANIDQSIYDQVVANGAMKANAEIGMIIVPATYIEKAEEANRTDYFAYFMEKTGLTKEQLSSHVNANQIVKVAGGYQIRCALVSIDQKDFPRNFRAILYYTTDGGVTYNYTVGEDERNVMLVAQRALADTSKTYEEDEMAILNSYATYDGSTVIYDMSKTETASKFTSAAATYNYKGTATSNVEFNGKVATQIHINSQTTNQIYIKYDLTDISLAADHVVKFSVYTPVYTDLFNLRQNIDATGVGTQELAANAWTEVSFTGAQFAANNYLRLVTGSTRSNYDVYLSDFVVSNPVKSAQILVSALPKADEVTDADIAAIQRAQSAVEALGDNSSINTDNLNACVLQISAKPYLVYDMSKAATAGMFANDVAITGYSWEGSITSNVEFNGKTATKIHVTSQKSGSNQIYVKYDKSMDLSAYNYVTFSIYTPYAQPTRIKAGQDATTLQNATPTANAWSRMTFSVTNFTAGGYFSIVTAGSAANYDIYISDIVAFSAETVKAMVEVLPAAAEIEEKDRENVAKAREYYNLLTAEEQAEVDSAKLIACEEALANLLYVVYDMSKAATAGKFTINNTAVSGYEWNGEITSGEMFNGKYALKLAVQENVDNQNQIYFQYALNVDLSDYTHVTFSVYSPYSGDVKLATGQEANRVVIGTAVANAWTTITVDASTFASKGYFDIITAQKSGYAVYLSDFIAYNAKSVQIMIDKLPEASEVTWEHEAQVVEVREYVNSLTSAEQATLDLSKLTAAEEAIEALPWTFYDMSDTATANKFTSIASGYNYTGTTTSNVTFDGKVVTKIHVDTLEKNQIYMAYDKTGLDLSDYSYVTFSLYAPITGAGYFNLRTAADSASTGSHDLTANAWTTITLSVTDFTNYNYMRIVTGATAGFDVYLTDFVAYKEHPTQYAINSLPNEITADDVTQVAEVRAAYEALSDDEKLQMAEARLLDAEEQVANLPLVAFNVANESIVEKILKNNSVNYVWKGSITSNVIKDGKTTAQIHVESHYSSTTNQIYLGFDCSGIDFGENTTLTFDILMTRAGSSLCLKNKGENTVGTWAGPTINANTWYTLTIPVDNFKSAGNIRIVTANGASDYDIYITNMIATKEATVEQTEYSSYAWSAPGTTTTFTGDLTTAYANYAAAGFDTVYMYGENGYAYNGATAWASKAQATVTAAKAAGINRFIVHHYTIDQLIQRIEYPTEGLIGTNQSGYQYATEAELDAVVKSLLDPVVNNSIGANVVGFALVDEPTIEYALTTGQIYKSIKRIYPNMEIVLNLLPGAAGTTETSVGYQNAANRYVGAKYTEITSVRDRYEYYINTFLKYTGADNLSVDMYPFVQTSSWFTTTEKFEANYYMTLQVLAEQCKIHNTELSFVLQSYQSGKSYAVLNQAQMRLQMNSILAFGAVNYSFFTYVDQTNSSASFVNTNGNTTNVYTYAQNVAKEADSLYSLLKGYRYQTAQVVSSSTTYTDNVQNGAFRKVTSISGGSALLATESINANGDCLYAISNVYTGASASVTINFASSVNSVTVYTLNADGGNYAAQTVTVSGTYSLSLTQGSAAYIVVNK